MSDREDLTDAQLTRFHDALVALRATLQHDLVGAKQRAQTVELDQAAVGRVSRIDAIQQQQMAAAERRRMELRLRQIQVALKAIDEDEYGDCRRCGEPVALARLDARPESPFCVACATTLGA
jgi:DnaK suppressor protein